MKHFLKKSIILILYLCLIVNFQSCNPPTLPDVTTDMISGITQTTAVSGGKVINNGGADVTARGVCWSTAEKPTISPNKTSDGTGNGVFASSITGLTANTKYYVCAYATNSEGTGYGNEVSFSTSPLTISDADGNTYATVSIGTQIWMAENLKTTKYNDGTAAIPNITDTPWENLTSGAYCWFNNNIVNKTNYGALYNWYAVGTGKLCPTGWHVATDLEWTTLENFLITNGYNYDGTISGNKIAKSLAATIYWEASSISGAVGNTDYTANRNKTGFTALPGGYRSRLDNYFGDFGSYGTWWSSTEDGTIGAWSRTMAFNKSSLDTYSNNRKDGFSVRCVKN